MAEGSGAVISNELGYIGIASAHAFLISPPRKATGLSEEAQSVFRSTMALLSHLMRKRPMAGFGISLHEAFCSCICEERPATVPECDKGLIDNLKGNTLSCGSGRYAISFESAQTKNLFANSRLD